MRAGRLDRRITIQRKTITQSDSGEEIVTWTDVATVAAEKVNLTGQERFAREQIVGQSPMTFRIRWSDAVKEVTSEHRIVFDGRQHDITDVRETKRRDEIAIDCYARSEEPVAP